jgi:UDP-glucose 4-epimerase
MRLLITGGLGYLGGRLAQYFEKQSNYDIVLGSRNPIDRPLWLNKASIVETKWDSTNELQKICSGVNTIIHLAGMNAQDCFSDPLAALEFNTVATARLLKAAVQEGVSRFIYFSTAHVYGSPLKGIINEKTVPESLHPYATSHRAAEDIVRSANQRSEIQGIVIRLSNSYGAPAQKDANCWMLLINDLCRQAVMTKKLVLKSSGLQRRDFVPLTDVCRATDYLIKLKNFDHDIFNIGGNWAPTVLEVALIIQDRSLAILGFRPEIIRNSHSSEERTEDLEYRTEHLNNSGLNLISDRLAEIDHLLQFCKTNFA